MIKLRERTNRDSTFVQGNFPFSSCINHFDLNDAQAIDKVILDDVKETINLEIKLTNHAK